MSLLRGDMGCQIKLENKKLAFDNDQNQCLVGRIIYYTTKDCSNYLVNFFIFSLSKKKFMMSCVTISLFS